MYGTAPTGEKFSPSRIKKSFATLSPTTKVTETSRSKASSIADDTSLEG